MRANRQSSDFIDFKVKLLKNRISYIVQTMDYRRHLLKERKLRVKKKRP